MRHFLLFSISIVIIFFGLNTWNANAQTGNIDWETLWIDSPYYMPPDTAYFSFLRDSTAYTSLAYDSLRKLIYVVSPGTITIGGVVYNRPRIYVLDAETGWPAYGIGRSCDPSRLGLGGELPIPHDTIVPTTAGYGFAQGKYCIYKIDMDDEGRIFVCNLVAPLWGACVDLDGDGNCNGVTDKRELDLKNQGPFRVWRWDTPTSTPVLVYATLDSSSATAIGDLNNSEQTHTRWGDAFNVVGKRGMYDPGGGKTPYLVDSARIYVSGGSWLGQTEWNNEVNMLVADTRPVTSRPKGERGTAMDYRLGLKLVNSVPGLAAHGIAVSAGTADSQTVWMESCPNPTSAALQVFHPGAPLPQVYNQPSPNRSVNTNVTGPAGAIRFFPCDNYNRDFLIVADGLPTSGGGRNDNTTARVIDVTHTNADSIVLNPTPQLGIKQLTNVSGSQNYCSAVDYTLDPWDDGKHLIVYILMSNNGIAAFRSRMGGINCSYVPIRLTSLRATLNKDRIDLTWLVTGEQMNYGFDVQRSFDAGREWQSIGFVPGRGTSNVAHEYAFSDPLTDEHIRASVARYRLHQLDSDGSASYSPTVEVFLTTAATMELKQNFPNPFHPSTQISYQLLKPGFVTLKIFNLLGEEKSALVQEAQEAGMHSVTLNAENLPSGTYVYQLSIDGQTLQRKMLLQR